MSFALPLRSFGRHAAGQSPVSSLRLQLGTTARGFSHKSAAGAAKTIATTFSRVNSSSPSSSLSRSTWAAPFALLAAYSLVDCNSRPLLMESQRETTNSTTVGTSPPFSSASSDTGIPYRGEMPKSDVNVYNLGFGTVCGICSGIFIKKGAKFIAFLLGGGFVLLQVREEKEGEASNTHRKHPNTSSNISLFSSSFPIVPQHTADHHRQLAVPVLPVRLGSLQSSRTRGRRIGQQASSLWLDRLDSRSYLESFHSLLDGRLSQPRHLCRRSAARLATWVKGTHLTTQNTMHPSKHPCILPQALTLYVWQLRENGIIREEKRNILLVQHCGTEMRMNQKCEMQRTNMRSAKILEGDCFSIQRHACPRVHVVLREACLIDHESGRIEVLS